MRMRHTLTTIFLSFFLGFSGLFAQQLSITDYLAECERKYGSDADLVNGKKYYYPYRQSEGDPFLYPESREAAILIHDKEFSGQELRYDIYNQKLILDYLDLYGAKSSLVLQDEWVKTFSFGDKHFIRMKDMEGKESYFQLVSGGHLNCVYRWSKNYLLNLSSGISGYYFTEPKKESFLVIGGKFYPYRNNRGFIKALDPGMQRTVKSFIKERRLKVNKAQDAQIRQLVEYCNSLYNEDS